MRHARTRVLIVLMIMGSFISMSAHARDTLPDTSPPRSELFADPLDWVLPDLDQELPGEDIPPQLALTIAFLELDAMQVEALLSLLQQRKQATAPLAQQISQLEHTLEQLLHTPEPAPAAIGVLVLQIRARRLEIRQFRVEFVHSFERELDDTQFRKLQVARRAQALEPVLNALDSIGLI